MNKLVHRRQCATSSAPFAISINALLTFFFWSHNSLFFCHMTWIAALCAGVARSLKGGIAGGCSGAAMFSPVSAWYNCHDRQHHIMSNNIEYLHSTCFAPSHNWLRSLMVWRNYWDESHYCVMSMYTVTWDYNAVMSILDWLAAPNFGLGFVPVSV